MKFRVLHVLDHSVPLHSGYAFRTLEILRQQRRLGWETYQLTSSKHYGATADEETVDDFHFYRTPVQRGGWRAVSPLDQWAVIHDTRHRLEQVAARIRPDVLHAHSPCLNGIAALRVARKLKLPVVYEMRASWEDAAVDHGMTREGSLRYRMSRLLETWTLRRADAITTICEGLRQDILSRGLPGDRVTVIPNAVNPSEFRPTDTPDGVLRARLGLDDAFTIGFIGSFYAYEGLDLLLAALPAITRFEPRTRVLLVGGGMEDERLKQQAAALGIADQVIFTGRVAHAEVGRYYSVVDLLVYPRKSTRLTETVTPLKPLEAMAQGHVLLASDVGGHRELIEHGKTGFLFAADDPDALARSVEQALRQRDNWMALRAAGRNFVVNERNWTNSVARYAAVYEAAKHQAVW